MTTLAAASPEPGPASRSAVAGPLEPGAFAVAGERGCGLRSETGFELDLHLVLATDARVFLGDRPAGASDRSTFAVRSSALQLDVRARRWLRAVMLVNAIDTRSPVTDAWAELTVTPALRIRVGKFPFPINAVLLDYGHQWFGAVGAAPRRPSEDTAIARR